MLATWLFRIISCPHRCYSDLLALKLLHCWLKFRLLQQFSLVEIIFYNKAYPGPPGTLVHAQGTC